MPQSKVMSPTIVLRTHELSEAADSSSCESESLAGKHKKISYKPNRKSTSPIEEEHLGIPENEHRDYITMNGTIARGRSKGKNIDVLVNMSQEELEKLEADMTSTKTQSYCSLTSGPHILLLTIFAIPISFFLSFVASFVYGTFTWYSIFQYFTESYPVFVVRLLMTVVLIVSYPFLIIVLSVGLGVFSMFRQIGWWWESSWREFCDFEKGFYGWLCSSIGLPDCSPYEVVLLFGPQTDPNL